MHLVPSLGAKADGTKCQRDSGALWCHAACIQNSVVILKCHRVWSNSFNLSFLVYKMGLLQESNELLQIRHHAWAWHISTRYKLTLNVPQDMTTANEPQFCEFLGSKGLGLLSHCEYLNFWGKSTNARHLSSVVWATSMSWFSVLH